jgi:hypothetical protein
MTWPLPARDTPDIDAFVTDHYLEGLLQAHARGADTTPVADRPADDILAATDRLARDLPRFHPSFRFEEALAARLAEVAATMRSGLSIRPTTGPEGALIPFANTAEDLDVADDLERLTDPRAGLGRPLLIGGALTSAAISIAGAAYVAWRHNRPGHGSLARTVQDAARTRLA